MASKENQTYQMVAISGFTVGVLSLGLAAVMFSSINKLTADKKAADDKISQQTKAVSDAVSDLTTVKTVFGIDGGGSGTKDVSDKLDEIVRRSQMGGDPAETVSLVSVTEKLLSKNSELNASLAQLSADYKQATDDLKAAKDSFDKDLSQANLEFEKAKQELAAIRATHTEDRGKINTEKDDLVAQLEKQRVENEGERDALQSEIEKLTRAVTQLRAQRDELQARVELTEKDNFDVADGKILQLSRQTRSVYINLGSADNLPTQGTFSVYAAGSENLDSAEKKGTIQVKEIVAPHLAECEVLTETKANPMVSNDLIFSATWQPGRRETFGITGVIDLDGDGRQDLDRLIDLIHSNGGEVVSIVNSDGTSPTGKEPERLTLRDKYLIAGTEPAGDTAATAATASAYAEAHSKITGIAAEQGVKVVALHKFLDMIGYRPDKNTRLNRRRPTAMPDATLDSGSEPVESESEEDAESGFATSSESEARAPMSRRRRAR